MDRAQVTESLELYLAERGRPLLRAAVLLTGSQQDGEDLLQAALERLLKHWRTVQGDPGGYLQRTLYNLAADGWRRERTWRRKVHLLYPSSAGTTDDSMAEVDLRDALIRLLLELPARQRAVIVLRYWEQLSEAEAAEVLGCSVGTVKSTASRGLSRMRELSESWQHIGAGEGRPPLTEEASS